MSKLINGFFMITSLIVIIALVFSIGTMMDEMGGLFGNISLEDFLYMAGESTFDEIVFLLAMLGVGIFSVFGFPVAIFLISYNAYRKE